MTYFVEIQNWGRCYKPVINCHSNEKGKKKQMKANGSRNHEGYSDSISYSQVPNKRGVPIVRGVGKLPKFNIRGVKINGGVDILETS